MVILSFVAKCRHVRPRVTRPGGQESVTESQLVMEHGNLQVRRPITELGGLRCTALVINAIIVLEHGRLPSEAKAEVVHFG